MNKKQTIWLIGLLLIAVMLRLAMIARISRNPLVGDAFQYDTIAWNVASGNGYQSGVGASHLYPTASRGPSYVLFVAFVYRVAGHNKLFPMLAQVMLEVISCLLVVRICRQLFRRTDVGLIAASIYAVYPPFILISSALLTESLINLLLLAAISGFLDYADYGKRWALYAGAVAIGIAALSKPILAPLPIVFFLSTCRGMPLRQSLKGLAAQLVLIALVMSPWIIRNFVTFHAFIPGVTQGGITFWRATQEADRGTDGSLPPAARQAIDRLSEPQREKWYYREGMRKIREDPKPQVALALKRIGQLWFNLLYRDPPSKESMALAGFNFACLVLSAIAVVVYRPKRGAVLLLLLLQFTILQMPFAVTFRHAQSAYAFIFCFTAAGLVALGERLFGSHRDLQDTPGQGKAFIPT